MTVWQDLVSTALVGTERRSFSLDRLAELVDGASPQITADGAEAQVLAAAAVLAPYRRAGRRPGRLAGELPDPVPHDRRPVCSDTAAQLLSLLLDGMVKGSGGNTELIREWLRACADRQRRPPSRLAVALLELGTAERPLRPLITEAVGPLAAWLGRANPEWAWAASTAVDLDDQSDDLESRYARAPRSERLALLQALRARDREQARRLLLSTWSSEPAAERATLLETLAGDLEHDDEPLLEHALDDRAASVRKVAAALLDRLPRSRRADRMAVRAGRLVRVDGRLRRRLIVELPETLDAGTRRDGITDDRESGRGLKAAWLTQIVAATPLQLWQAHLSATPEEAVRLAAGEPELIAGWQRAAMSQRDERWAAALLTRHLNPDLLGVVPPEQAHALLRAAVMSSSVPDTAVPALVAAVPGPWPADLGGRVIDRVRKLPAILASMTLPLLAARLAPDSLPVVDAWIDRMPEHHLRREVQAMAHTVSIRQTIQREFA